MKKVVPLIFIILGFSLFGIGIYSSFEIYATKKQEKINANLASFVLSALRGEEVKVLDYPEQSFFIFKSSEGKTLTSGGVLQTPIDVNLYLSYHKSHPFVGEVYIYSKRYSFGEFVEELIRNPASLGISLSGILLFLIGVSYMFFQKGVYKEEKVVEKMKEVEQEFLASLGNKLKALRLILATHRIIPQEGAEEAKKIVDGILKEMEKMK